MGEVGRRAVQERDDHTPSTHSNTAPVTSRCWHAMTVVVDYPPGTPAPPPHRHPSGPAFGLVLEGEMLFEVEGQPPRVVRAGQAFWEPGGDVIHYSDANNRDDMRCRFTVTMLCAPGQPMLVLVDDDELDARKHLRVSPEE